MINLSLWKNSGKKHIYFYFGQYVLLPLDFAAQDNFKKLTSIYSNVKIGIAFLSEHNRCLANCWCGIGAQPGPNENNERELYKTYCTQETTHIKFMSTRIKGEMLPIWEH